MLPIIFKKMDIFLLLFLLDNFEFSKGKHFKNKVLSLLEHKPQKLCKSNKNLQSVPKPFKHTYVSTLQLTNQIALDVGDLK